MAYAVPSASIWALIGFGFGGVGIGYATCATSAAIYAGSYGLSELQGFHLPRFEIMWQVPATWVKSRRPHARILVWGAVLGPGVFTRNPYPSMWVVPLTLAGVSSSREGAIVGAVMGLAHGGARAIGVLGNISDDVPALKIGDRQRRWRRLEAYVLTTVGVVLGAAALGGVG